MATLVIAHSHVHLHYNTQVEKQGMVARPQKRQNVSRCRDGENVFKVSMLMTWFLHGPALLLFLEEPFFHALCIDAVFYSRVGEICAA